MTHVRTTDAQLPLNQNGWYLAQAFNQVADKMYGDNNVVRRGIIEEAQRRLAGGYDREFIRNHANLLETDLFKAAGRNAEAALKDAIYVVGDVAQMGINAPVELTVGVLYGVFNNLGDAAWVALYGVGSADILLQQMDEKYKALKAQGRMGAREKLYGETYQLIRAYVAELKNPADWKLFLQGAERLVSSPVFAAMDAVSATKNTVDAVTEVTAGIAVGGGRGLLAGLGHSLGFTAEGIGAVLHAIGWASTKAGDFFDDTVGDWLRKAAADLYDTQAVNYEAIPVRSHIKP